MAKNFKEKGNQLKEEVKEEFSEIKKFTSLQYANIIGKTKRLENFLSKKYGNTKKTIEEWGEIFKLHI